jgi:hypothetical protein
MNWPILKKMMGEFTSGMVNFLHVNRIMVVVLEDPPNSRPSFS